MTVEDRKADTGALWIYCSYAPGAGKTYRMLEDGRSFSERGESVVIASLFDSKREYLSRSLSGLTLLNESSLRESPMRSNIDVGMLLERRPGICIIDEMSATNLADGKSVYSEFSKILSNGISVLTTLNLVHIRGLQDDYLRIGACESGVIIDDSFFLNSDRIIFVDIEPRDLLERYRVTQLFQKRQGAQLLPYASLDKLCRYRDSCFCFLEKHCICTQEQGNAYYFTPTHSERMMPTH